LQIVINIHIFIQIPLNAMARHRKFDKKKVLENATSIFWKQGFSDTSIQDLVDHTGINRASLYDSFQDKHDLFESCFLEYRDKVFAFTRDVFSKQGTIKEGFEILFKEITEGLYADKEKKGCLICNSYTELLPPKKHRDYYFIYQTKDLWIDILISYLEKAIENKEIIKQDINTKEISHSIYGSLLGVTILSKTNTNIKELEGNLKIHLSIFK